MDMLLSRFPQRCHSQRNREHYAELHSGSAGTISLVRGLRFCRWAGHSRGVLPMCDYSLHSIKSRPARVGEKLRSQDFNTGTRGFASLEDATTAVCVLPGTELAFASPIRCSSTYGLFGGTVRLVNHKTAI